MAIAALCASLSFTLAALLDRLFKLEVIINSIAELKRSFQVSQPCDRLNGNADIAITNPSNVNQQLINEVNSSENDKSSSTYRKNNQINNKHSTRKSYSNIQTQIRHKTTTHSELIRQLFGKSSAFFIGIIVALFYSHLLLIFGSLPSQVEQSRFQSPPISYKLITDDTKLMSLHKGYFSITRSKPDCTLLLTNQLPYVVFVFDIFLLPVLSLIQIYACILILKLKRRKTLNHNETKGDQQQNSHSQDDSVRPTSAVTTQGLSSSHLLKLNVILGTAAFSFVLNIPSLVARVILMIVFAVSSNNTNTHDSASSNMLNQPISNHNNERNASIGLNYSLPQHIINVPMNISSPESTDYFALLNVICNKLDILLLISTSHKFIIIITQCRLVQWCPKKKR